MKKLHVGTRLPVVSENEELKDENVELYRTQLKLTGIIKYIVGMTEFAGKEKATRDTDIKKHVLNFVKGLEAENEALKLEAEKLCQRVAELANKGRSRNLSISDYSDVEYVQAYFEAHFEDFDELVADRNRLRSELTKYDAGYRPDLNQCEWVD
jgi:hypothetical protein